MTKIKRLLYYYKIPFLCFSISLIAAIIGCYLLNFDAVLNSNFNKFQIVDVDFFKIFINNSIIVLIIYISVMFTRKVAYLIYIYNGLNLGIAIGCIIKLYNLSFLYLIIPHGIIEVPAILFSGYIVTKGEKFIRTNLQKTLCIFVINIILIFAAALIESFITPVVYYNIVNC